ncbi:MAG: indole-3-glycerol-phosphate synthase [Candidatus Bathyarchaeota archaeon]
MNFIKEVAEYTKRRIAFEYHNYHPSVTGRPCQRSLSEAIKKCSGVAVIGEIKPASPSLGHLREISEPEKIAAELVDGGVVGISVITEPKYFHGSLENLVKVRKAINVPVLMKDFVVHENQIVKAAEVGADSILFIPSLCSSLFEFYLKAFSLGIEPLFEVHSVEDVDAVSKVKPRLVGINNRDLATLQVNLDKTKTLAPMVRKKCSNAVIVSESGIRSVEDVKYVVKHGANAILVGTALMQSENIAEKVKEFREAV